MAEPDKKVMALLGLQGALCLVQMRSREFAAIFGWIGINSSFGL